MEVQEHVFIDAQGRHRVRPVREVSNALSSRELDVLWLYGFEGMAIKQVGSFLGISEETGKSYLKRIREKFWARGISRTSRTHLYVLALTECVGRQECRDARDELLRTLLNEDAPELLKPDATAVDEEVADAVL